MKWTLLPNNAAVSTEALILPFYEDAAAPKLPSPLQKEKALVDMIELVWHRKEFSGKAKQMMIIPLNHPTIHRLMLVGLGTTKDQNDRTLMQLIGSAFKAISSKPIDECTVLIPSSPKRNSVTLATLLGIAVHRALYHFKRYKSKDEKKEKDEKEHHVSEVKLLGLETRERTAWERTLREIETIAPLLTQQRDWGNIPSNECTPDFMAAQAKAMAKTNPRLTVTVMDKAEIKKSGMGALYGVGRGAGEHPRFIIMEYWGKGKSFKPFVFVGKGITFDTGGISLKPSEKMHEMKFDMLGAAAVLNATAAIAAMKLPVNIVALAPCTENVPGGESYKPGDVLKAYNGKTMEILNTDAEGRVILADALSWAHQYTPSAVVDLATLTGAALVVLGNEGTPIVSNAPAVATMVKKAAALTNDRVLELPLWDEFKEAIKSEVADVKNITDGFGGSVITAAAFLEFFVRPLPWVHLDIAGTGWYTQPKAWTVAGATDIGVHLLVEVAKQWKPVKKV